MQHLDFTVWMLGFPIMSALESLISTKAAGKYEELSAKACVIYAALYFGIGAILW